MTSLLNLTYQELLEFVTDKMNEAPFRAAQIWEWIWRRRAKNFDEITVLSKNSRQFLKENACITWPSVEKMQISQDGTVKFLLTLYDNQKIETVLIPSLSKDGRERFSLCLSSQVGCSMGCTFCSTGEMGFTRNLSMQEILGQILIAKDYLNDSLDIPKLKNLVFMGMGEPLLNIKELLKSLEVCNSEKGLGFSPRRMTVSTCGIKKGLEEFGKSNLGYIAISLHAPNQELRKQIMPKAAAWPLEDLMEALKNYPLASRESLTFEYLLLKGINDSVEHAKQLAKLLAPLKAKVNIICYNPAKGSPYQSPTQEAILSFEKVLWAKGITTILRKSKGQDIDAACGQLIANSLHSND